MRASVMLISLLGLVVLLFSPFIFQSIFRLDMTVLEISFILNMTWWVGNVLMTPVILLLILEREMKGADVWLHSTASIRKLIGVKIVYISLVVLMNLFLSIIVMAVHVSISDIPITVLIGLSPYGFLFLVAVLLTSVSIMLSIFAFWVFYRWILPVVKGAVVITIAFGLFSLIAFSKFVTTTWYEKYILIGPIKVEAFQQLLNDKYGLELGNLSVEVMSAEGFYYVGEMAVDIGLSVILFLGATKFFEKKVRV